MNYLQGECSCRRADSVRQFNVRRVLVLNTLSASCSARQRSTARRVAAASSGVVHGAGCSTPVKSAAELPAEAAFTASYT